MSVFHVPVVPLVGVLHASRGPQSPNRVERVRQGRAWEHQCMDAFAGCALLFTVGKAWRSGKQQTGWHRRRLRQAAHRTLGRDCRSKVTCAVSTALAQNAVDFRELGAKGVGVVAIDKLRAGTLIVAERPLLTLPVDLVTDGSLCDDPSLVTKHSDFILGQLGTCTPEERGKFWELEDAFASGGGKSAAGIVQTNACQSGQAVHVFPIIARFNHSCKPNVHRSWQEKLGSEVLYATRDIQPGEELCLSYIFPLYRPHSERRSLLQRQWSFTCGCEACTLGGDAQASSDSLRKQLATVDYKFKVYLEIAQSPTLTSESATQLDGELWESVLAMSDGIEQEFGSNAALLYQAFFDAYQVAEAAKLNDTSLRMLHLAEQAASRAMGPDSSQRSVCKRCMGKL